MATRGGCIIAPGMAGKVLVGALGAVAAAAGAARHIAWYVGYRVDSSMARVDSPAADRPRRSS